VFSFWQKLKLVTLQSFILKDNSHSLAFHYKIKLKMKAFTAIILATAVAAVPSALEERQGCTYGFVFARGSTERSPLVSLNTVDTT